MKNEKQLRGHCQVCGRFQAVPNGRMAHHGYRVRNGWFEGACSGHNWQPIEKERAVADRVIEEVSAECAALEAKVAALQAGEIKPEKAKSGKRVPVQGKYGMNWGDEYVAFAEAEPYYQEQAVKLEIWNNESRARQGRQFVEFMVALIKAKHGQALIEVAKPEAAAPILPGEKRQFASGVVVVALYQERGRVWYRGPRGENWIGSRSWRALAKA